MNPNPPSSYDGSQGPYPDPNETVLSSNQPRQSGQNPNNYPNPYGTPPNPYGTPPNPYGTPPPATPGAAPYDPYAVPPTVAAPPSSPSNPYTAYPPNPPGANPYPPNTPGANPYPPYPNNAPPPLNQPNVYQQQYPGSMPPAYNAAPPGGMPPVAPRRSSGSKIVLIVLAVLVVLGGIVAVIGVSARNSQIATENANATATVNARNTTATAQVRATTTAQANATATAIVSTYPFSANVKLNDPLTDNSRGNGWLTNNFCSFTGGAYHIAISDTPSYVSCYATKTNFTDFTYQVDMKVAKGDFAGLTFRGDNANSKRYALIIGQTGDCILFLYTQDKNPKTLYEGMVSASIAQGATLGVVARGSKITLYVNNQQVTSVNDSTLGSGQIGTIAYYVQNPADVSFSNAKVWQL
jgi:hypothetical protein